MYAKRIQIANYGPIQQIDIKFPFDDDKPRPVVLVGANGSGKSVLLSHIVNALMMAQQNAYKETPEVEAGKVYKLRSPQYVSTAQDYSFARVDFVDDLWFSELQLNRSKKDYGHPPDGLVETDAEALWNGMAEHEISHIDQKGLNQSKLITDLFKQNCILYFPPNRFEEPAWLNETNLKSKASHMDLSHLEEHTDRRIVNHSPLELNQNWVFDLAYDSRVFELKTEQVELPLQTPDGEQMNVPCNLFYGLHGKATTLYDVVLSVVKTIIGNSGDLRLGIGNRHSRGVAIISDGKHLVPNIFQLSSGEVSLLNLFLTILRDYDLTGDEFTGPADIKGIVIVDEIDLHLHAHHQYEVLPSLIKMFPRVQFIVTSHSPLFILGLQRSIDEQGYGLYHLPEGRTISPEEFSEFGVAYSALSETRKYHHEIRSAVKRAHKSVIFVDGQTDVQYHRKAAKLLGFEFLLDEADFRDGGGMLRKIWSGLMKDHVERKKVIVLHDPEEKVQSDERVNVYRRRVDRIDDHPIQNGVENLFSMEILERASKVRPAFIDRIDSHHKLERGVQVDVPERWSINKDEKTNLCKWICEHGTANDFRHFQPVLEMLHRILVDDA